MSVILAPPPPAVRAGGAGGLVLPEETAAHASETLAYSGIVSVTLITRLGRQPSKASSPLAHQFCVFLSSSSARCCPAVPEPLLEPSTWPGAVIIGVRALALAPYLEPRGVYFILVLSTGEAENESCLEGKNIDAGCSSCAPGCCHPSGGHSAVTGSQGTAHIEVVSPQPPKTGIVISQLNPEIL